MAECTTIFQWTMHIFFSSTASSYSNRLFRIIRNKENSFANTTKLFQLLLKDSNFFSVSIASIKLIIKDNITVNMKILLLCNVTFLYLTTDKFYERTITGNILMQCDYSFPISVSLKIY